MRRQSYPDLIKFKIVIYNYIFFLFPIFARLLKKEYDDGFSRYSHTKSAESLENYRGYRHFPDMGERRCESEFGRFVKDGAADETSGS